MNDHLTDDVAMEALRGARPASTVDETGADSVSAIAMLDAIMATPRSKRRVVQRTAMAAAAVSIAAVTTAVVLAVSSVSVHDGTVVVHQQPAAANVLAIARTSTRALAASGRAEMTFDVDRGSITEERGTSRVAFSGPNLDIELNFAGANGTPGFTAHNKTVDGQFYLLDGVPGAKHWYHDIGATPVGSDLFDIDPRTLLSVLQPTAGFVVVGSESTPQGTVRHLHATDLGALPALHLALGPVDGRDITGLDLWVSSDNTVQRVDLTTSHTETQEACIISTTKPSPKGNLQAAAKLCLSSGGVLSKHGDHIAVWVPATKGSTPGAGKVTTTTTTSSYSLRFYDIGAPIAITAPPDPIEVHGKG